MKGVTQEYKLVLMRVIGSDNIIADYLITDKKSFAGQKVYNNEN